MPRGCVSALRAAALTDHGLTGLVAMVAVRCHSYPKMTIYNSSGLVYRSIRDMQMQMGVAK